MPVKYRKMFANSLVLPHFDYLDTIYGRASKSKLHELEILYKKVEKIILCRKNRKQYQCTQRHERVTITSNILLSFIKQIL